MDCWVLDVCTLLAFFLVVCHSCDIMLIVFFVNYHFGNNYLISYVLILIAL